MKFVSRLVAAAIVLFASPAISGAASPCPPEVKEARVLLTAKTAAAAKVTKPSKSQVAARGQEEQGPRGQETQAPRGQETQAPRNVTKGRANALANARRLVNEAEVACKDADGQRATINARAAMELLKYVP